MIVNKRRQSMDNPSVEQKAYLSVLYAPSDIIADVGRLSNAIIVHDKVILGNSTKCHLIMTGCQSSSQWRDVCLSIKRSATCPGMPNLRTRHTSSGAFS